MQRIAFTIRVKPEKLEAYRKLHNSIWPELIEELKAAGLRNYSLWLQPDGTEFGYLECDDWQASCAYLAESEVHDRWQQLMQEYLLTPVSDEEGGQPIEMLERVFLLQ